MKRKLYVNLIILFGIILFPLALFAQPANDNCADAIAIGEVTMEPFSTEGATTDGPAHADDCISGGNTPDSTYNDIWYLYTAGFTGTAAFDICGTANFDTKIFVYAANTGCNMTDADIIACSEDGPNCDNATSLAVFDVMDGVSYRLRLGGWGEDSPGEEGIGTFTVGPFTPPVGPENNDCMDALEVFIGVDQEVSNVDATTDGPEHPNDNVCFGFNDSQCQNDIWYSFTAPNTATIEWSTCDQVNWDSRIVVYGPNISCDNISPDNMIACSDATAGCANFTNILNFEATAGETYTLRMGGYNGAQGVGTFDLIEIIPPEPPANDQCSTPDTAWIISPQAADDFEVAHAGTVINSTISDNLVDPICGDGQGGKFPDVWFKFNNEGNDSIEIRYFAEIEMTGFLLEIFQTCDGDTIAMGNSCFQYDPDDIGIITDTITGLATTPTDYLIRVSGWLFWTPGPFFFQLVKEQPAPPLVNIKELDFPGRVDIAPNPVKEDLQLSLYLSEQIDTKVQIYNILGQVVIERDLGLLVAGKNTQQFDTSSLTDGVYTLVVLSNEKKKALKFVKN